MKQIFFILLIFSVPITLSAQNDVIIEEGGIAPGNTTTEVEGMIRYNGTSFEYFSSGSWTPLVDSNGSAIWSQNTDDIFYNSGNVGIGTSTPLQKLHVGGNGNIRIDGSANTYTRFDTYQSNTGGNILQIDPVNIDPTKNSTIRLFRSVNVANANLMIMRGNNTTAVNHLFNSYSNDSYLCALAGNLGIGTSTPTSKLTISDTKKNSLTLKSGNNLLDSGLAFQNGGTAYSWSIYRSDAGNNNAHLVFSGGDADANIDLLPERMRITDQGNVGIGTADPQGYKLAVNGNIGAEEIEVRANYWADFVFEKAYSLRTIHEVKEYIKANGHLPDVPSESEAMENPLNLANMDILLLQKIEELTLYTIDQEESIEKQNELILKLEKRIEQLEKK